MNLFGKFESLKSSKYYQFLTIIGAQNSKFSSNGPAWPINCRINTADDRAHTTLDHYDSRQDAKIRNFSALDQIATNNFSKFFTFRLSIEYGSPPKTIDSANNRSISPIAGRANGFTTKSYFQEFREIAKYSNLNSHSPERERSSSKNRVFLLFIKILL